MLAVDTQRSRGSRLLSSQLQRILNLQLPGLISTDLGNLNPDGMTTTTCALFYIGAKLPPFQVGLQWFSCVMGTRQHWQTPVSNATMALMSTLHRPKSLHGMAVIQQLQPWQPSEHRACRLIDYHFILEGR